MLANASTTNIIRRLDRGATVPSAPPHGCDTQCIMNRIDVDSTRAMGHQERVRNARLTNVMITTGITGYSGGGGYGLLWALGDPSALEGRVSATAARRRAADSTPELVFGEGPVVLGCRARVRSKLMLRV